MSDSDELKAEVYHVKAWFYRLLAVGIAGGAPIAYDFLFGRLTAPPTHWHTLLVIFLYFAILSFCIQLFVAAPELARGDYDYVRSI